MNIQTVVSYSEHSKASRTSVSWPQTCGLLGFWDVGTLIAPLHSVEGSFLQ